jgi:pimeloyl-ACP methyl ester carboxylesterase
VPAEVRVDESGPAGAPLVLLIHGSMDRSTSFAKVARRLDDRYRVVRYDRRGYGRSRGAHGPFGIAAHVADAVSVLDGRVAAAVVGHSYGGNVALALAYRHPGLVRAVGVYESPMSWEPWWPVGTPGGSAVASSHHGREPEEVAEGFMRRMVGDDAWARLPERTRNERRAEGLALVGELEDLRRCAPFDPARMACPVLVAHGELGQVHHQYGAEVLAARFGRPVVVLAGARHGAHSSQPDAFAAFVEDVVAAGRVR